VRALSQHSDAVRAEDLIRRAAQVEIAVPPGAQARVWSRIEKKRARAAWRLAFPMFAAGAATAALLLLTLVPRETEHAVVLLSDGTQREVAGGASLPLSSRPALVDLHGAGRLVTGPDTAARLDRFEGGKVAVSLSRGSVLIHVNPRSAQETFDIRAPGLSARVVGTVLRVAVNEKGRAELSVGHGSVEVTPDGEAPRMVKSGERWPAEASLTPSAAELELLGAADLEGASFTAPAVEKISEHALYSAGWQQLKAGEPRRALATWRLQREKFPRGVLDRDAQTSIIDALVALHDDGSARAELEGYLREVPDGLRAAEMHFVLGTLYASDHDCRRAVRELDLALRHPADPWAKKARAARAACSRD
jgi:hypothetical protein